MSKNKKKEIDEFKCDICQRIFYRKGANRDKDWTKVNDVGYGISEKVDDYEILCRTCLSDGGDKTCRKYSHLITPQKKRLFYHYRYTGLLSEGRELYKE